MNPYDKTSQELKRQQEGPKRFAKAAAGFGIAAGAGTFAPILSRMAPLLSQYIPQDLAIKGLTKISPNLGKFVKSAMDDGYDFEEVKNFMGEKIQESTKAQKNIIEKESPELHQTIFDEIKKGMNPAKAAAGAIFDKSKRFEKAIKKLEKQHNKPFNDIVREVYGSGERALPKEGFAQQETQRFENEYGTQGAQSGQGQQALMAILQKINQKMGQ